MLVCGSRDYTDRRRLFAVLDHLAPSVLVEGCAKGADRLAEEWAVSRRVPNLHYPADWGQHGRGAGVIRNRQMANQTKPDMAVAFYADRLNPSKGTADMVAVAQSKKIPVILP